MLCANTGDKDIAIQYCVNMGWIASLCMFSYDGVYLVCVYGSVFSMCVCMYMYMCIIIDVR